MVADWWKILFPTKNIVRELKNQNSVYGIQLMKSVDFWGRRIIIMNKQKGFVQDPKIPA